MPSTGRREMMRRECPRVRHTVPAFGEGVGGWSRGFIAGDAVYIGPRSRVGPSGRVPSPCLMSGRGSGSGKETLQVGVKAGCKGSKDQTGQGRNTGHIIN